MVDARLTFDGMRRGAVRLAPVSLFVVPFGIAFGAAANEAGVTRVQALLMSATVFAGASQFAALELWGAAIPLLSLALVTLAVNARHVILGATLAPWLNALPLGQRVAAVLLMSDANFADSHNAYREGERDAGILLGGGLIMWAAWMAGTSAGLVGGAALGALDRFGVDVVMAAFFAAIVVGGLKAGAPISPPLAGSFAAVATFGLLPSGWNIVIGALCGGLVGFARAR